MINEDVDLLYFGRFIFIWHEPDSGARLWQTNLSSSLGGHINAIIATIQGQSRNLQTLRLKVILGKHEKR